MTIPGVTTAEGGSVGVATWVYLMKDDTKIGTAISADSYRFIYLGTFYISLFSRDTGVTPTGVQNGDIVGYGERE